MNRTVPLALVAALFAAAAVFFALRSHERGVRLRSAERELVQLRSRNAELEAAVRQAESESGHPIFQNQ